MAIIRRRGKRCADCGEDISHRGNRAERCRTCQAAHEAAQERTRYQEHRDAVSTRRTLRRQDAAEFDGLDDDHVVDYSQGGFAAPGMVTVQWRQPRQHDAVSRARMRQQQNSGESDMASWMDLQEVRASGRFVDFHPAQDYVPQRGHNAIGQSYPRPSRRRGMRQAGIDNGPVPGVIVNSAPDMTLEAQRAASTRGALPGGQRIYAGQLAASPPSMLAAEAQVVEQERRASEHARSQAPSWRR